jgi:alpha-tubulin suppressor-like RCC1 family protein
MARSCSRLTPARRPGPIRDCADLGNAGCDHSLALFFGGALLAWGYNAFGQLGDGTTATSGNPVQVDLPNGWAASVLGTGPAAWHALAIAHTARP